jgi:plastocyanin
MRKRRIFPPAAALAVIGGALAVMLAGALAAAAAPGDRGAAEAQAKRVVVMDNFFEPRSISIHKGERVVWVWKGDNSHNITFIKVPKTASRKGADTRRAGRWSRKFRKRGFYKYVCTIHSGQRGTIEVGQPEAPVARNIRPATPPLAVP